jgi:hypothetical protein
MADLVVLDADIPGDRMGGGTTSRDLVRLYRRTGVPVVLLADPDDLREWRGDPDVVTLPAAAGVRSVLNAARQVLGRRQRRPVSAEDRPESLDGPKRWFAGTSFELTDLSTEIAPGNHKGRE